MSVQDVGGGHLELDEGGFLTMFHSGPAKGACRLAGLPKPTGCI